MPSFHWPLGEDPDVDSPQPAPRIPALDSSDSNRPHAWTGRFSFVRPARHGLGIVQRVHESDVFIKRRLRSRGDTKLFEKIGVSFVMLFAMNFLFLGSFGFLSAGDWLGSWLINRAGPLIILWQIGRWSLCLVLLALAVAVLDYALPNLKRPWRCLLPGILFRGPGLDTCYAGVQPLCRPFCLVQQDLRGAGGVCGFDGLDVHQQFHCFDGGRNRYASCTKCEPKRNSD